MRRSLPKHLIRPIQKAIVEFALLENKDRVLIGLSGGKDSIFLLYALTILQKHLPFSLELAALTVDLGFGENDWSPLAELCETLKVSYHQERAELASQILEHPTQNPCAQCAYFRRAIIHNYARKYNFNKVAFAHHYDDAVETFLLSILYGGQIWTFLPKTYLDQTGVTVIRPLVYLREKEIKEFIEKLGMKPLPSLCVWEGRTKRAEIKKLLQELEENNPAVFAHLAAAMRKGGPEQRWSQELAKGVIRTKSKQFWSGKHF